MRRSPPRSCIGCRSVRAKEELIRIVRSPEGRFVLDRTGRQAGRGAYLCPSLGCLRLAVKRKSFDRALRQPLPKEALAEIETGVREHVRALAGSKERSEYCESENPCCAHPRV